MKPLMCLFAIGALAACGERDQREPAQTPLPTRQTTIEPVVTKIESAREEAERRRRQVDEAAK